MAYSEKVTYKLNFTFEHLGTLGKNEPTSEYKEGELFSYDPTTKRFTSLADGAQISEAVAAKVGKQMRKKMFVPVR